MPFLCFYSLVYVESMLFSTGTSIFTASCFIVSFGSMRIFLHITI